MWSITVPIPHKALDGTVIMSGTEHHQLEEAGEQGGTQDDKEVHQLRQRVQVLEEQLSRLLAAQSTCIAPAAGEICTILWAS